ncbi:MAG: hypothetical protein RJA36_199 [Pseudomonadota bacterium]|jgi:NitT/TauT family transport system substrate-binding protein
MTIHRHDSLRRRLLASGLGGLALASGLAGCREEVERPLTIAAHVWPGYEPLFMAQREAWLDAAQVQLLETRSATASLQALAEGRVQGAALTLDEVLKARAAGLPLAVVMVFDVSAGADMVVARPPLRELSDLKGRRIAFEQGALGELMLVLLLRAAGLQPGDVRSLPMTVDAQSEAWRLGLVDACISYDPVASQLIAAGGQVLFDSRQLPNTIVDVLALRREVLDRRGKALRHLLAAHFRALGHLNRNPQDAAYRMARHLGLRADEVLRAFRGLLLPDAANNRRLLGGREPMLLARARELAAVMASSGLLGKNEPLDGLIRADYLPRDRGAASP